MFYATDCEELFTLRWHHFVMFRFFVNGLGATRLLSTKELLEIPSTNPETQKRSDVCGNVRLHVLTYENSFLESDKKNFIFNNFAKQAYKNAFLMTVYVL